MRSRVQLWLSLLALALLLVATQAGGSGVAAVLGAFGATAGLLHLSGLRKVWVGALLAFTGWAALSCVWGPFPPIGAAWLLSPPAMIVFGGVLYTLAAQVFEHIGESWPRRMQLVALGFAFAVGAVSLLNAATEFAMIFPFHPLAPGADPNLRLYDVARQVSRGVCVATLLAAPFAVGAFARWGRPAGVLGLAYLGVLLAGAVYLRLWVVPLALVAVGAVCLLAWWKPNLGLRAAFAAAGASVLFGPFFGLAANAVGADTLASLPFSWEQRLRGWKEVWLRIGESPWIGNGFGTARTMDDRAVMRGFDLPLVSLHPHNAGLHIWLDVGAVGAGLATLAIVAMWQAGERWADRDRAIALAGVVAAGTVVSAVSFGVWQHWWWASLALAAALVPVMVPRR